MHHIYSLIVGAYSTLAILLVMIVGLVRQVTVDNENVANLKTQIQAFIDESIDIDAKEDRFYSDIYTKYREILAQVTHNAAATQALYSELKTTMCASGQKDEFAYENLMNRTVRLEARLGEFATHIANIQDTPDAALAQIDEDLTEKLIDLSDELAKYKTNTATLIDTVQTQLANIDAQTSYILVGYCEIYGQLAVPQLPPLPLFVHKQTSEITYIDIPNYSLNGLSRNANLLNKHIVYVKSFAKLRHLGVIQFDVFYHYGHTLVYNDIVLTPNPPNKLPEWIAHNFGDIQVIIKYLQEKLHIEVFINQSKWDACHPAEYYFNV